MKYSSWSFQSRALGLPKWQLVLLVIVAAALGVAIAIVATGIFLIALPVAALAILAYRLLGHGHRRPPPPQVIEGEYEVVESARAKRGPDRR